jgi:hypothetical protein
MFTVVRQFAFLSAFSFRQVPSSYYCYCYIIITKKKKTVVVSVSENDVCEIMVFVFSLFHLATVLFIKERYQELS